MLREAQLAVKKGFEYCLSDNFTRALEKFQTARKLFLKAGDVIEADVICLHFIAYCYHNTDRQKQAHELFQQVNDFCDKRNYKWFLLMNLDWLIGSEESLEHKSFTEIKDTYETDLENAEKMGDSYMTQKFLLSLVRKSNFVKQETFTLNYLHKLFQFSKQPNLSARQKFRNLDKAVPIFALSRFQSFAKEVVLESVALAEPMSDPLFVIDSQINAGIVHTQTEDFVAAEEWLNTAAKNAERLEEKTRQIVLAKIFLQTGHLEKKRNRLQEASEFYNKSVKILEKLNAPVLLYEAKKSRLVTYQQIGNDDEVEKDISSTLRLAEKYREKILDEQDKNKFFDNEQDIYDVAVEHKLRSGETEQAYNYSEISNSRSLLDWLLQGANNREEKTVFGNGVKPLEIDKIRKKIPSDVQLLQYSVLPDKVVIWVLTKENFSIVHSRIDLGALQEKVRNYIESIKEKKPAEDLSRELYDLLIAPALPHLDKNKEVCLIPDKILFYLSFSSLISPEGNYFLEEFKPIYSPSANVFVYASEKAKHFTNIKSEKLLSIGNPAFDPRIFPNLKSLPEAEGEAREIAVDYDDPMVLTGVDAVKSAFQNVAQNFEIIHFAGHYIVQPDLPLSSKLIMAKSPDGEDSGSLTNRELMNKKIPRTKLIVLSACQTGIEKYSDGEGLIGLSRTFLSLGVPIIVASQWKIDSEVSADLMKNFHRLRRRQHLSTSQALREAQLQLLHSAHNKYRSPYFWAGFAVFGGYAEY